MAVEERERKRIIEEIPQEQDKEEEGNGHVTGVVVCY